MDNHILQKLSLRSAGIVGAAIFATFFALTYSVPGWVETLAADYIETEAEKSVDGTIDAIRPPESDNALARIAQSMFEQNEARIDELKSNLKNEVHEQWVTALASIRDLDCECRRKYADMLEEGFKTDITLLQAANDRTVDFIQSSYMDVATELKRDIRIFTARNAAAFILLLPISFLKPQAITHLFLPGLLLAASTLLCSYFYIFKTNWLMTMIHSNYLGFAYLAWLGIVFLFLCDIVFNRGLVTKTIINAISNAIGSAFSAGPC